MQARIAPSVAEVVAVGRDADPELLEASDVVVNLADTAPAVVRRWAQVASRAGGYVDAAPTESTHRVLADVDLGPAPVLPGAGFASVIGDALVVMASQRVVEPTRADVTTYVPARRSLLAGATPRERADLLHALLAPMSVLLDGRVVDERIAEDRRLAWFPRPVGPHHAAAVPGTHWRTLPRVVPSLRTVRTGLALRSSSAELLQALGNAVRFGRVAHAVRWPCWLPVSRPRTRRHWRCRWDRPRSWRPSRSWTRWPPRPTCGGRSPTSTPPDPRRPTKAGTGPSSCAARTRVWQGGWVSRRRRRGRPGPT